MNDNTQNLFRPGFTYAIRYRRGIIDNPNLGLNNASGGLFTRHTKLLGSTGIGDSTLQTTSVTSESRAALIRPSSVSTGTPLINRPSLFLRFQLANESPALKTFPIRYPDIGESNRRIPETFTNSSPLVHTEQGLSPPTDHFNFGE